MALISRISVISINDHVERTRENLANHLRLVRRIGQALHELLFANCESNRKWSTAQHSHGGTTFLVANGGAKLAEPNQPSMGVVLQSVSGAIR